MIPAKPTPITAVALVGEFANDAPGAHARYTGQLLEVTGKVARLRDDEEGHYYLGFEVHPQTEYSPFPPGVICYIDPTRKEDFAGVEVKHEAKLVGKCKGTKPDPSIPEGFIVILEDCRGVP